MRKEVCVHVRVRVRVFVYTRVEENDIEIICRYFPNVNKWLFN